MSFAPQNNWPAYREMTRSSDEHWVRNLSLEERFTLYADLFNSLWRARQDSQGITPADRDRLDRWNWERKRSERDRQVQAFLKRDERIRERTATSNAG